MNKQVICWDWSGNYGRAWVSLLEDPRLSEHARMCYVAMTSFGPESRASFSAIMRRMGIRSRNTLRAAQAELVACGWMRLLREATPKEPARWLMLSRNACHDMTSENSKSLDFQDAQKQKVSRGDKCHVVTSANPKTLGNKESHEKKVSPHDKHDQGGGHDMTPRGSRHDPPNIYKQEDKQEIYINAPKGALIRTHEHAQHPEGTTPQGEGNTEHARKPSSIKNEQTLNAKQSDVIKSNSKKDAGPDQLSARHLIAAFCDVWAEDPKRGKYPVAPKDAGQAKLLLATDATLTIEGFQRAVRAYLYHSDAWTNEHGHSLSGLVAQWSRWALRARGRGRGSGMSRLGEVSLTGAVVLDDIPF